MCVARTTTNDAGRFNAFTAFAARQHPTPIPMLNNATIAQLRALKLQGFADALQQQHDQAD